MLALQARDSFRVGHVRYKVVVDGAGGGGRGGGGKMKRFPHPLPLLLTTPDHFGTNFFLSPVFHKKIKGDLLTW